MLILCSFKVVSCSICWRVYFLTLCVEHPILWTSKTFFNFCSLWSELFLALCWLYSYEGSCFCSICEASLLCVLTILWTSKMLKLKLLAFCSLKLSLFIPLLMVVGFACGRSTLLCFLWMLFLFLFKYIIHHSCLHSVKTEVNHKKITRGSTWLWSKTVTVTTFTSWVDSVRWIPRPLLCQNPTLGLLWENHGNRSFRANSAMAIPDLMYV